jgi:hypothetical protein
MPARHGGAQGDDVCRNLARVRRYNTALFVAAKGFRRCRGFVATKGFRCANGFRRAKGFVAAELLSLPRVSFATKGFCCATA